MSFATLPPSSLSLSTGFGSPSRGVLRAWFKDRCCISSAQPHLNISVGGWDVGMPLEQLVVSALDEELNLAPLQPFV
ncbi:hypothetical protein FA13DRAFT_1726227 [Coprinellus micaceus]|uniref:Uncharacterized protein n=1 Tax=Coprinellus micaceus TaxID=71717 RepID=A0A4Y7TU01_COPMI|nr:hypothetical protein FA13DRAFT_1726227 [Coprinellus micaceus]